MAINPDDITTVRVDQLGELDLTLTSLIAHCITVEGGSQLYKATVQEFVDIVSTAIGTMAGVGFLPLSVIDGQQLPDVPELPSFFLCGPGTYLNVGGFPDVICTGQLNAVMSLTDRWAVAVEIPIIADSTTVIEAGTNITITGSGTVSDPYVISASGGGGGTQDLESVLTEGNTASGTAGSVLIDVDSGAFNFIGGDTGDAYSEILLENTGGGIYNTNGSGKSANMQINSGVFQVQQLNTAGDKHTNLTLTEPTADANWRIPAKSAGNYDIASETYVDTKVQDRIKIISRSSTPTSALTGTTTETQMLQIALPTGTFSLTDFLKLQFQIVKTTGVSTCTWRVKLSTSATLPSGNTDRIWTFTDGSGARTQRLAKTFWQNGGNLTGVEFSTSSATDIINITTAGSLLSTMAFNNVTTQYYLYISAQLTNSADSVYLAMYELTN